MHREPQECSVIESGGGLEFSAKGSPHLHFPWLPLLIKKPRKMENLPGFIDIFDQSLEAVDEIQREATLDDAVLLLGEWYFISGSNLDFIGNLRAETHGCRHKVAV